MTLPLGIETQLRNQAGVLTQGKAPSDLLAEGKSVQRGRAVTSVGGWGGPGKDSTGLKSAPVTSSQREENHGDQGGLARAVALGWD